MAEQDAPTGAKAVAAVAESKDVDGATHAAALAFFMGEESPPGDGQLLELKVDMGAIGKPKWVLCSFKALEVEQIDKAFELARTNTGTPEETLNAYLRNCYLFAYSIAEPSLVPAMLARQAKGEEIADTAGVVGAVFRKRSGVLRQVVERILQETRSMDETAVQEVEAGKTSS